MRVFFLFLLCCIDGWPCVVQAQKIQLSEREEINLRNDDFAVEGHYKNFTVVYLRKDTKSELVFYDAQMKKEKVSQLHVLPAHPDRVHISCGTNSIILFYAVRENKKFNVYYSRLQDHDTWSEPVLLDSSPHTTYHFSSEYRFTENEDHTQTSCYHVFEENGLTVVRVAVVDQDGQLRAQWEQSYTDDISLLDETLLTNTGTFYMLATSYHAPRAGYQSLTLLEGRAGEKEFKKRTLDLRDHAASEVHLAWNRDTHALTLCGYFSDGKYSAPRGLFFTTCDDTSQTFGPLHFTPLTLQLSSSHSDLREMPIRNILLKQNGELLAIAEKSYQNTRTLSNLTPMFSSGIMMNGMTEGSRLVHEYVHNEIVLFCFKPDGSLNWSQTILKEQVTQDDNGIYSSFGLLQHRLGDAFLFSDLSSKQARLLAAYVSASGALSVKELQTNEETDPWSLMPRSAMQVSKSEIVMPCLSRNYLCFLKIRY